MTGQYLTGRPVYGGGSYAPTRGQVSAQGARGYMQRQLRQKAPGNRNTFGGVSRVGGDGQSDTRSGVARNALQRKLDVTKKTTNGNTTTVTKQQFQNEGRQPVKTLNQPKPPLGPNGQPVETPPLPTINANGTLDLPYNQQFGMDVLNATQDMNTQLLELQRQQQQNALQFTQGMRQTEQDYGNMQRDTLNDNAARGTAFSSGYGLSVGQNAAAYNQQKNDFEMQNAGVNQDIQNQRLGIQTAFQDMLRQAALARADETSVDAGNLGYGNNKDNNPKPKPKPKSKLEHKKYVNKARNKAVRPKSPGGRKVTEKERQRIRRWRKNHPGAFNKGKK